MKEQLFVMSAVVISGLLLFALGILVGTRRIEHGHPNVTSSLDVSGATLQKYPLRNTSELLSQPDGKEFYGSIFFTKDGTPFVFKSDYIRTELDPTGGIVRMVRHGDHMIARIVIPTKQTDRELFIATCYTGYDEIPDDALPVYSEVHSGESE